MSKRKKLILAVILVIVVTAAVYTARVFLGNNFWAHINSPFKTSKLNILVVGYDSDINGPTRADTIIIASIDLDSNEIGVLSIPRDTRLNIPGYGMNRVNASHAFGGIELTEETLESFLGVNIDYYVETNFKGFASIIDALGGVEIVVENRLHYIDEAGDLYINLHPGRQVLDGEKALHYVRYRGRLGDIGRVERQQKFIKAVVKKVLSPETIVRIPSIYNETQKAVNTNIPITDINPFMQIIKGLDLSKIEMLTLPGYPEYINEASYWIVDEEETEVIVNKLIKSKEFIKNINYDVTILNGNGTPGLANEVSTLINKYGFNIENVANAEHFDYPQTLIFYYNHEDKELAENLQQIIGGNVEFEEIGEEENTGIKNDNEIKIIIGNDYQKELIVNNGERN